MSHVLRFRPCACRVARVFFSLRALVAVAALFVLTPALAASFDYADAPDGTLAFAPWHFVLEPNGDAWAMGNATVHYRSDGSIVSIGGANGFNSLLIGTSEGGIASARVTSINPDRIGICTVAKRASGGGGQWIFAVDDPASCDSLANDGGGTLWITTRAGINADSVSVYRIGSDGVGLAGPIALPANFVALSLAASKTDGSYVAGYDSVALHPSVVALDANGAVRWQFIDTSGNGQFTQIGVDQSGNVRVAGEAADHTLVVAGIDSSGSAIGVTRAAARGADRTSGLAIAADGSTVNDVPSTDGTHRVLQRIDPSEVLIGQTDIPVQGVGSYSSELDGHAGLRIAPNGDILVLADAGSGSTTSTTLTLVRFSSAGDVLATTEVDAQAGAEAIYASSMAAMPDSSALVSVYAGPAPPNFADYTPPNGRFVRIDTSGQIAPSPFLTANVVPAADVSAASLIGDDGTAYLLTNNALDPLDPLTWVGENSRVALSAISPAGALLWKFDADGWVYGMLALDDNRICIFGDFAPNEVAIGYANPDDQPDTRVECHDTANGVVTSTATLLPASATPPTIGGAHFAADGTLVTVYAIPDMFGSNGNGIQVTTLDVSGQPVAANTIDTDATLFAACDDGSFGLVANDSNAVVTRIAPDGSVAWSVTLSSPGAQYYGAQCLEDGSFALEGLIASDTFGVTLLAADGSVRWSTTTGTVVPGTNFSFENAASDATSIYVSSYRSEGDFGGAIVELTVESVVTRIDRSSGVVRWMKVLDPSTQHGIAIDPTDDTPVWYAVSSSRITLHALDPATGTVQSTMHRTCGSCAYIQSARITDDGTMRYVLGSFGNYGIDVPHFVGIDAITSTLPSIDIAQPSLSGIWYAPYTSGQGFGIDVAPGGTIFMPWFTYAPHDDLTTNISNDPSALNWYSLQGASDGSDSATLTIYSNTGGAFASGVTTAEAVGNATLSFSDCGHGELDYQFDASGGGPVAGRSGTIDIVRLTQQIGECSESGGASEVGVSAGANDGFDTNQSGAWYDLSTGGQGIELSIVPPSTASAGLLFGAWFTYDPSGHSDDPTAQHWFTLQADFSGASNGSVIVPIYSTLGGSFDGAPGRTTLRVGQATLTFQDCSSATFAYQFDDTVLAGAYRRLGGTLHLAPLTACSQ